jgi:hypothetical protein
MKKLSRKSAAHAFLVLLALAAAPPAHAEKVTFDHRLYPPLKAVLDGGDSDMVAFDPSNPRYVVDLIAIKGKSARDWDEALEIIVRAPDKGMSKAQDWLQELAEKSDARCPGKFSVLAEEGSSITVERLNAGCATAGAQSTITRILTGKRSLFMIRAIIKGTPDPVSREQWLSLMASAHIE